MNISAWFFNEPFPFRKLLRSTIRRLELGNYRFRYEIGALRRQHYAYLVYQAARLAARLGEPAVSILEFGVAGGEGLKALEYHAVEMEKLFPVKIEIYGFDTGEGLPPPDDYRDLPYQWKSGFFRMNQEKLRSELKRAKLVIGNVSESLGTFAGEYKPAPIGGVSQDLDFYSSTVAAFSLFDELSTLFLPRVICYFDDTIGGETELYGDFTGERLAIDEFNETHKTRKISPIYYLRTRPFDLPWNYKMWSFHLFDHLAYNVFVGAEDQQLPLA